MVILKTIFFELVLKLVPVFVVLYLASFLLSLFQKRNTEVINSKVEELKKQMRGERLFIADSVESPDRGSVQFFGEPFNVSIGPGMTLIDLDGREHRIEEVYLKDDTPDVPDPAISSGMKNCALLIKSDNFDLDKAMLEIEKNIVVGFKIK